MGRLGLVLLALALAVATGERLRKSRLGVLDPPPTDIQATVAAMASNYNCTVHANNLTKTLNEISDKINDPINKHNAQCARDIENEKKPYDETIAAAKQNMTTRIGTARNASQLANDTYSSWYARESGVVATALEVKTNKSQAKDTAQGVYDLAATNHTNALAAENATRETALATWTAAYATAKTEETEDLQEATTRQNNTVAAASTAKTTSEAQCQTNYDAVINLLNNDTDRLKLDEAIERLVACAQTGTGGTGSTGGTGGGDASSVLAAAEASTGPTSDPGASSGTSFLETGNSPAPGITVERVTKDFSLLEVSAEVSAGCSAEHSAYVRAYSSIRARSLPAIDAQQQGLLSRRQIAANTLRDCNAAAQAKYDNRTQTAQATYNTEATAAYDKKSSAESAADTARDNAYAEAAKKPAQTLATRDDKESDLATATSDFNTASTAHAALDQAFQNNTVIEQAKVTTAAHHFASETQKATSRYEITLNAQTALRNAAVAAVQATCAEKLKELQAEDAVVRQFIDAAKAETGLALLR